MNFLDQANNEEIQKQITLLEKGLSELWNWFLGFLPNLIAAIIIFIFGMWLSKFICKLFVKAMNKTKADQTVTTFLRSVLNIVLKILVIISVVSTLGFDMTSVIATLSAAVVTIGLALKDSLSNVASGALIIINKKFKVGDYLETEGLKGKVVKIEIMHTILQTYDNKEIIIPNSRLMSNNITNYFVLEDRRVDIQIGISYDDDIDRAKKVAWDLIHSQKNVLQDRPNAVLVDNLGESSVNLMVRVWCKSEDYWEVLAEMNENLKKSFDAHGISIPYNQLDLHIKDKGNTKL
ncbi:MAG: mechanosensitive ion channel family protein [Acutalibacteraceae bacterium]